MHEDELATAQQKPGGQVDRSVEQEGFGAHNVPAQRTHNAVSPISFTGRPVHCGTMKGLNNNRLEARGFLLPRAALTSDDVGLVRLVVQELRQAHVGNFGSDMVLGQQDVLGLEVRVHDLHSMQRSSIRVQMSQDQHGKRHAGTIDQHTATLVHSDAVGGLQSNIFYADSKVTQASAAELYSLSEQATAAHPMRVQEEQAAGYVERDLVPLDVPRQVAVHVVLQC